jgi:uncharacterized protein YkwD
MHPNAFRAAKPLAAAAVFAAALATASPALADSDMYRLYNPWSGEHFYTASASERDATVAAGWSYEGIGWIAPDSSATPVWRLYSGTDHHYTTDPVEKSALVAAGWTDEGLGWYSADETGTVLYRQFNPYVDPAAATNNSGSHNYTVSKQENDALVALGWHGEGVGWYGVDEAASRQAAVAAAKARVAASSDLRNELVAYLEDQGYATSVATWAAENCGADWNKQRSKKVFESVNAERVAAGTAPLVWDEDIYALAAGRAQEIQTDFSHDNVPAGYGENIVMAAGYSADAIPELFYQLWHDSEGHHANYMYAGYTRSAIAISYDGAWGYYGVQLFD